MSRSSGSDMDGNRVLKITEVDIADANRLSLSCPICAGAVEKNSPNAALAPVLCSNCQTLYHRTCWEQHDGKCATLGCEHTESHPYGTEVGPRLTIKYSDIPKHAPQTSSPNGRFMKLKNQERGRQGEVKNREFWRDLFSRILRAFGWR